MKIKILLISAFSMILNHSIGQVSDSVTLEAGYTNQVFYKLSDGTKTSSVSSEWDLQFFSSLFSASIRINSGFGVKLFEPTNTDTSNFTLSLLDTFGMVQIRDLNDNWERDAFTSTGTGHPDYGWGVYGGTGLLTGKKIFVIQLSSGVYKKIWMKKLLTAGGLIVEVANLDGTGMVSKTINRNTYSTKHHFYYDVENDSVLDVEPLKNEWELVFRKYEENVGGGLHYSVTGSLSNYNVDIAEVRNVEVNTAKSNWTTYTFSDDINLTGYDWKSFNNTTFTWDIEDSLSYFIKDKSDNVYQVVFTGTGGSANGKLYFTKELIATASLEENSPFSAVGVYPNPVKNTLTVNYELANKVKDLSVTLLNLNGKVVKKINNLNKGFGFNQGEINVADLNNGVYLVVISSDSFTTTKKIIKN